MHLMKDNSLGTKDKRILVVIGSHRKQGNCELFGKEIAQRIAPVESIDCLRMTDFLIKPCTGCYRCLIPDQRCGVKDDYYFMIEKMRSYDSLIFAVPTYVLGPIGQIKMFADRVACISHYYSDFRKIRAVSAVFGGITGWRGVTQSMVNSALHMMGLDLRGSVFIEAALPGECLDEKYNEHIIGLSKALSIVDGGYFPEISDTCKSCGSDIFFVRNGALTCTFCESASEYINGGLELVNDTKRFSEAGFSHHFEEWLKPKLHEYNNKKEYYKNIKDKYKTIGNWVVKE
jgi:multimeric flavodoxin WrbA